MVLSAGILQLICLEVGLDSKTCESCYLKRMFTQFSFYSTRKECMHEYSSSSSNSLYVMQ